jgi:uncharacterized membrane protein
MPERDFWKGLATGAMIGASAATGVLLFTNIWGRAGQSGILRLEKSIQIGRPIEEVFDAWRQLETLPAISDRVLEICRQGDHSHWRVHLDGRDLEWDAQVEQVLPNQSIGWKLLTGPKHTGRINFSPLGNDTLVHVTMNCAPPSRWMRPFLAPMTANLEGSIEAVLRDFKHALENPGAWETLQTGPRTYPAGTTTKPARATGTFDVVPRSPAQTSEMTQHTHLDGPPNPVEFSAPPEAKR